MSLHDPETACGIMLDEWLDFVAWSDALALADCRGDERALVRLAHPVWCLNGVEGRLYWTTGEISTRDPDSRLLNLMIQIAHRLEARVRDGRGWFYLSVAQRYRDPPAGSQGERQSSKPRGERPGERSEEKAGERPGEPLEFHARPNDRLGPFRRDASEPPESSVSVQVLVAGSLVCLVAATAILIQS